MAKLIRFIAKMRWNLWIICNKYNIFYDFFRSPSHRFFHMANRGNWPWPHQDLDSTSSHFFGFRWMVRLKFIKIISCAISRNYIFFWFFFSGGKIMWIEDRPLARLKNWVVWKIVWRKQDIGPICGYLFQRYSFLLQGM